MRSAALCTAAALAAAAATVPRIINVGAVKTGDEEFRNAPGYVYVLSDGSAAADDGVVSSDDMMATPPSIDVVDPETLSVIASLPVQPETSWADAVYMERCEVAGMPADQLVFAADRGGQVYVINATALNVNDTANAIITTVPVGEGPVHSYALPSRDEFWVHADDSGWFDVISLANISELRAGGPVVAHVDVPGHGKLLVDASMPGYPLRGFASNVAEPAVYDLVLPAGFGNATIDDTEGRVYNFSAYSDDPTSEFHCPGTHGLAYSKLNDHVYATCSDVGLIEIDIVGEAPVMLHRNATGGQAFTTPDEHYVVVVDKTGDSVHVVVPGEPGAASSMDLPSVDAMGGNPDKVAFFELPDGSWRMFVSLTDNFHSLVDETAEGDSGVGWVDLDAVYDNPDEAQNLTKVPGAGAVTRNGPFTHRAITTSGSRVATITHHPITGVALIDGVTGELEGVVPTNQGPGRVLHVPAAVQTAVCSA